jgi:hypothetical protein
MKWFIIKDNYIINHVEWDGITPYVYPYPHDTIIQDIDELGSIGDWYEASENIFYRPLSTPPDFPGNP